MKLSLGKKERLKSKKLIELLFKEGKYIKEYPIKLLYLEADNNSDFPVNVAFTVPKRNFKKAVERNRLKRLLRETYRKEKPRLYKSLNKSYIFMFILMGNESVEYKILEKSMNSLLSSLIKKLTDEKNY